MANPKYFSSRAVPTSGALVAAVFLSANAACAGSFSRIEQSAEGQGAAFASSAAGTSLNAMFWNPAAVTNQDGLNNASNFTVILPRMELTALPGSTFYGAPGVAQSADSGHNGYLPSMYFNWQVKNFDPRLYLGLALNAPFGLRTGPDRPWAGSPVNRETNVISFNVTPMVGYKFSEQFSAGIGLQLEYMKGKLKSATGAPDGPSTFFEGDDITLGVMAGLTYSPAAGTRIGLGWRSAMTHDLEGTFATNGEVTLSPVLNAALNQGVSATARVRLPHIVTLSLNQAIAANARVLGTVEWSNWSRIGVLTAVSSSTGFVVTQPLGPTPNASPGTTVLSVNTAGHDGWRFAGGFEYDVNPQLTVRTGVAYEISPISSPYTRFPGLPDSNSINISGGFSYSLSPRTTLDVGYSHVFLEKATINQSAGPVTLVAKTDVNVDTISIGVRMKLDD